MKDRDLNPRLFDRRSFLIRSAALAAASMVRPGRLVAERSETSGIFALGVASGDPSPDGFVLWTRVTRNPTEPEENRSSESIEVSWMVAEDEAMTRVVREGCALAEADWAHSVHVEVEGLRPDRWYWYRFQAKNEVSPVGRTRTFPPLGSLPSHLRFAFASCQKYEMGYYTAYEHMAREDLDLVVFLGDYIYEKEDSRKGIRPHGLSAIQTLDDYRRRYSVYKTDHALQKAHARFPWIVTWDDHEVGNDYAGAIPEDPDEISREDFLLRRAFAYRSYYEHMPLRRSARPQGPDMTLYRSFDYGELARFCVLDTRQYRSDQPEGPRDQPVGPALEDPGLTMLGQAQKDWLAYQLSGSPAVWNIIAQQVLMARVDFEPGPAYVVDVDKWAGYESERRWLLRYLRDEEISNPVVLTGDVHENWAIELSVDAEAAPVAVELVGTSISSSGNGVGEPENLESLLAANPGVKFHNDRRGYVRCEVTPETWRADFQTVPFIDRPGAPLETSASFEIENGDSRLQRVPASI